MRFNNFRVYGPSLLSKGFAAAVWHARQNVIAAHKDRPLVYGPYMAELDITYRCNCRCRMCQRWRDPRRQELTLAEYQRLAESLHTLGSHQVSISGGEPLLREDVFDIISAFADRGMSVNLCTNGMLAEEYAAAICASGATCVTISLDGATASCHDEIRGFSGSYIKISKGIKALLKYSSATRPTVRVRMTISNRNLHELRAFYRQWHNVADDVLLQPVHNCNDAYYTGLDDETLQLPPHLLAAQISGTPMETDGYMRRLLSSLREHGKYPFFRCYAGILMARIDPWGNIYPCLEQHTCVGSVRRHSFQKIWGSANFNLERNRLATDKQCRCWYNNTALIGHYGRLLSFTSVAGFKVTNTLGDFCEKR